MAQVYALVKVKDPSPPSGGSLPPAMSEEWTLDSGATSHVTASVSNLSWARKAANGAFVRFANNQTGIVTYTGEAVVKILSKAKTGNDYGVFTLRNVLVVPTVGLSLLSVNALCKDGHKVVFNREGASIEHGTTGKTIHAGLDKSHSASRLQVQLIRKTHDAVGNVFISTRSAYKSRSESVLDEQRAKPPEVPVETPCNIPTNLRPEEKAFLDLWHRRLGHLGLPNMLRLSKTGRIPTSLCVLLKKAIDAKFRCPSCTEARLPASTPPNFSASQTTKRLELIHMDVQGEFDRDPDGHKYALTIVDNLTRRVWALLLLDNSAPTILKSLKAWMKRVERAINHRVQRLRTDGQFDNKVYHEFFDKHGITPEFSAPYTSQQNGVAERFNRTLQERMRAMLANAKLHQSFWPFAMRAAVYHVNRSPTTAIDFAIPEERWTGKEVTMGEMKPFGCLAWVYVPKGVRMMTKRMDAAGAPTGKHSLRSLRGVFLGYAENRKAWTVYVPWVPGQKFWISTTVKFDENATYDPTSPGLSDYQKFDIPNLEEMFDHDQSEFTVFPGANRQAGKEYDPDNEPSDTDESVFDGQVNAIHASWVEHGEVQVVNSSELVLLSAQEEVRALLPEPRNWEEAMQRPDAEEWRQAAQLEMGSHHRQGTWKVTSAVPPGKKAVGSKWVFKIKIKADGTLDKYKARIVAQGYAQQGGIDYKETFSPTALLETVRLLCALAHHHKLELESMDVVAAYLHGTLKEEVYMKGPPGFPDSGPYVRLVRSLYGLKQSGREWNEVLVDKLTNDGYKQCVKESCVFVKGKIGEDGLAIVVVYVDDLIIATGSRGQMQRCKETFKGWFAITDNGPLSSILGLRVDRSGGNMRIMQTAYIDGVVNKFKLTSLKPKSTPLGQIESKSMIPHDGHASKSQIHEYASMIGCLNWIAMGTRPDIAYAVSKLSRFMANPGERHFQAGHHVIRYLNGTKDVALHYVSSDKSRNAEPVFGMCDADYGSDISTRKSISGYIFRVFGCTISWSSKMQRMMSASTGEAEYYSLAEACREAVWLGDILEEITVEPKRPIRLACDSTTAIRIAQNPELHSRTKHFDILSHIVRDNIKRGVVETISIGTDNNAADGLTKILAPSKLAIAREQMGLV